MRSGLRKCTACGRYTLAERCGLCHAATFCPVPPRYSPEDRMGEYRRRAILERYGENGKLGKL